ncbi:MAG TPA: transcriptional regulator [Providencia sp.]|nr:winged helix-turn-helix domain-containing protein [Providencia sp.]HBO24305.1 transcriptional regulator [Providencia sp.]
MKYFINNHIIYDSHQGLLYTDDVNNAIKLTTTLNRLLLVLVQNNDEVLDRETLLQRVWDDYNQVVSDNNLNSSVSVLRRHLSSFLDEEIITTIPKVGIKFSASLKFEDTEKNEENEVEGNIKESINENTLSFTTETQDLPSVETQSKPSNTKKSYILNNRYLEVTLIVIIIFCLLYLFKSYFFVSRTEYPEVGKIDQCSIRYINSYHKPDTKIINFTTLQEQLLKLNIDCTIPATLFYYNIGTSTDDKTKNNNSLFLSYCPTPDKNSTTISCDNIYVK